MSDEASSPDSAAPSRGLRIQRLLVPTDFSEPARKALRYAVHFAQQFGAEVHLVHVVDLGDLNHTALRLGPLAGDRLESEAEKSATEALEKLEAAEVPDGVLVHTGVSHGPAVATIESLAKELEIDLLIVSTHGHTGLAHALLGSTAERIARHAPCPVLMVREREHDFL